MCVSEREKEKKEKEKKTKKKKKSPLSNPLFLFTKGPSLTWGRGPFTYHSLGFSLTTEVWVPRVKSPSRSEKLKKIHLPLVTQADDGLFYIFPPQVETWIDAGRKRRGKVRGNFFRNEKPRKDFYRTRVAARTLIRIPIASKTVFVANFTLKDFRIIQSENEGDERGKQKTK